LQDQPTVTASVRLLYQNYLSSCTTGRDWLHCRADTTEARKPELSRATSQGFDIELVWAVSDAVSIPVIASSGAGCSAHFTEVFQQTKAAAALAAGIFHRKEVQILDVKRELDRQGIAARLA